MFHKGTKGFGERDTKTAFRNFRKHISARSDAKVQYATALAMWKRSGETADYNPRPIGVA